MNPEFRRNVWIELSPRRLVTMAAVLLMIFFVAALLGGDTAIPAAAGMLYYIIVVFWGTRNAAMSVVGEIRDRTWDSQRLSSLGAAEMTWGKLFGATVFNWYGGAICLAVILAYRFAHQGVLAGLSDLVYYPVIGLIAQSAAFLSSLAAILRRQSHTRLEIFAYQGAGLLAAIVAFNVWEAADRAGSLIIPNHQADFVLWWGHAFDARAFLLLSLALFAGWMLLGCYRAMRLELKMRNGPLVWLAFLVFMGVYFAGFDAWVAAAWADNFGDAIGLRLVRAALSYAFITYAMVFFEPKDRVLYRWLGDEIARGRIGRAAVRLQGWMMSYCASFVIAVSLIAWLEHNQAGSAAALAGSAAGYLTRDVAIVVLLQTLPGRRRGDFAALVALFALYVLAPAIIEGLGLKQALVLFYPRSTIPVWLAPSISWAEAFGAASIVIGRLFRQPVRRYRTASSRSNR